LVNIGGHWLLNVGGHWLLNIGGDWLLNCSSISNLLNWLFVLYFQRLFGIMNNLSLNWDVFVSNVLFRDLNVIDSFFRDILRNVLPKILYGIVVSDSDFLGDVLNFSFFSIFNLFHFSWHSFNSSLILVFNDLLFEGHVFNSALSLDDLFTSVDGGANNVTRNNLGRIVVGLWDVGGVGGGEVGGWDVVGGGVGDI
jgi:hypothetical protein